MTMTKRYIKWDRYKVNDNYYKHPNTDRLETYDEWIVFEELGFHGGESYLGTVEFDTDDVDTIKLAAYRRKTILQKYKFDLLTLKEVNILMKEWYPDDHQYFELDSDGFTIIDNRPITGEVE